MDLVLLQPGNTDIVTNPGEGGSLIAGNVNGLPDDIKLDGCIELLSYHSVSYTHLTLPTTGSV